MSTYLFGQYTLIINIVCSIPNTGHHHEAQIPAKHLTLDLILLRDKRFVSARNNGGPKHPACTWSLIRRYFTDYASNAA